MTKMMVLLVLTQAIASATGRTALLREGATLPCPRRERRTLV